MKKNLKITPALEVGKVGEVLVNYKGSSIWVDGKIVDQCEEAADKAFERKLEKLLFEKES